MAFDNQTRNRLQKFVTQTRSLLVEDFLTQLQSLYGIQPNGHITDFNNMTHLDKDECIIAQLLRERIKYLDNCIETDYDKIAVAIDRLLRELAFTILNRFAAIRMSEERGIINESVVNGFSSKGFKIYLATTGSSLGDTYERYKNFIYCLWDELSIDLGILFERNSPYGLLFPREQCLDELFVLINDDEISHLWREDETIGWIYQYFNSKDEREKMRKESQAPRNSRELAVRNQFFTPRYVVEFLSDNTLARIWYEMTQGNTKLINKCNYMVKRPNEIFMYEGEQAPAYIETESEKSQEELLNEPLYIPFRKIKDPRDILMLDPACGSMHFGLYVFDLYETIYEEAWDTYPELLIDIRKKVKDKENFLRLVPELIIRYNIHGIDIDHRAVQIANLSLWLRAQRSWKVQDIKSNQRPLITKSNVVCAEPMPGDEQMLEEFVSSLNPSVLGGLVKLIWDKMKLAGEAGALLQIEKEISSSIEIAKKEWIDFKTHGIERPLFSDIAESPKKEFRFDIFDTEENFWDVAEDKILSTLKSFSDNVTSLDSYQKKLFAEDTAQGFAFIDICKKKYDVVLMNPPFGNPPEIVKTLISKQFPNFCGNLLCAFSYRSSNLLRENSFFASITDRTWLQKTSYESFREDILNQLTTIKLLVDLDWGVLDDAQVATCMQVVSNFDSEKTLISIDARLINNNDKETYILHETENILKSSHFGGSISLLNAFSKFPDKAIAHWCAPSLIKLFEYSSPIDPEVGSSRVGLQAGDTFRFFRLSWEVPYGNKKWKLIQNGGHHSPFFRDAYTKCWSDNNFIELRTLSSSRPQNLQFSNLPGITWGKRTDFLAPGLLPENQLFSNEGHCLFITEEKQRWFLLSLLNSRVFQYMINLFCGQHKAGGYVGKLPYPDFDNESYNHLVNIAKSEFNLCRMLASRSETNSWFLFPINYSTLKLGNLELSILVQQMRVTDKNSSITLQSLQRELDEKVFKELEIPKNEQEKILKETNARNAQNSEMYSGLPQEKSIYNKGVTNSIISYIVGCIFGRWDIRFALRQEFVPIFSAPFDPIPICPPGMLVGSNGEPAESGCIVSEEWLNARPDTNYIPVQGEIKNPTIPDVDYPINISWNGILVDDSSSSGVNTMQYSLIHNVRNVLGLIWSNKTYDIDKEVCDVLDVTDLREYFFKPSSFFQDHLNNYSVGRRKAPIYWPLSTPSGSYTLWIYYPRINDQTLYKCIMDFVDPRIEEVDKIIDKKRFEFGEIATIEQLSQLEKDIGFLQELRDFKNELLRVTELPYKPNLNDGVLITASPLYNLFRLPKWKKDLENCWNKLEKGDFDWAHIAYSIWPDRVKEKCKKDKSIAIAHDLERLFIEPVSKANKKKI